MKTWENLTTEQKNEITVFHLHPPGFYRFVYRLWDRILKYLLWVLILSEFILGLFHNPPVRDVWQPLMIIFGIICIIGYFGLMVFLWKHFYTKVFAKRIGLTMKEWNNVTIGMRWQI